MLLGEVSAMCGMMKMVMTRLFIVESLRNFKKRNTTYVVAYWKQNETYDDAEDFELTKYELGADIVCGDLVLS